MIGLPSMANLPREGARIHHVDGRLGRVILVGHSGNVTPLSLWWEYLAWVRWDDGSEETVKITDIEDMSMTPAESAQVPPTLKEFTIQYRMVGTYYVLTSPEIYGLYCASTDLTQSLKMLAEAIPKLIYLNRLDLHGADLRGGDYPGMKGGSE